MGMTLFLRYLLFDIQHSSVPHPLLRKGWGTRHRYFLLLSLKGGGGLISIGSFFS